MKKLNLSKKFLRMAERCTSRRGLLLILGFSASYFSYSIKSFLINIAVAYAFIILSYALDIVSDNDEDKVE